MKRMRADFDELCAGFAVNNEEIDHYLDVETGKVIVWMDPIATGFGIRVV